MSTKADKSATNKAAPLRIHEGQDANRSFLLLQENNDDLLMRTGRQVIAHCRLGISIELWVQEYLEMSEYVRHWCAERETQVRACFSCPRGFKVVLFVVPSGAHFDFELADELVTLNDTLTKDFNLGTIETRQIPWDEVDRFLDPKSTGAIYGEQPTAHHSVEA